MRILMLPSWYPNLKDSTDGNFNYNIARAVSLYTPVVLVFSTSYKGLDKLIKIEKTTNQNLEEIRIYFRWYSSKWLRTFLKLICYFIGIYNAGKFHIIHCLVYDIVGSMSLFLGKILGKHTIITEHHDKIFYLNEIQQKAIVRKYQEFDFIVSVGNKMTKLINKYLGTQKLAEISNPVLNYFNYQNVELEVPNFLHISNLAKVKQFDQILTTFSKLVKKYPSILLTVISDGNALPYQQLAASLNIPSQNILWIGKTSQEELPKYFHRASAFIFSSKYETFGMVLAEALCCGCPVITSLNGGLSDQLSPKEAICYPVNNLIELEKAMEAIILKKIKFDRAAIANSAQKRFSEAAIGEKYIEIYHKLLTK